MVVVAFFLIPVFWQINNYFGYAETQNTAKLILLEPFKTLLMLSW